MHRAECYKLSEYLHNFEDINCTIEGCFICLLIQKSSIKKALQLKSQGNLYLSAKDIIGISKDTLSILDPHTIARVI